MNFLFQVRARREHSEQIQDVSPRQLFVTSNKYMFSSGKWVSVQQRIQNLGWGMGNEGVPTTIKSMWPLWQLDLSSLFGKFLQGWGDIPVALNSPLSPSGSATTTVFSTGYSKGTHE